MLYTSELAESCSRTLFTPGSWRVASDVPKTHPAAMHSRNTLRAILGLNLVLLFPGLALLSPPSRQPPRKSLPLHLHLHWVRDWFVLHARRDGANGSARDICGSPQDPATCAEAKQS